MADDGAGQPRAAICCASRITRFRMESASAQHSASITHARLRTSTATAAAAALVSFNLRAIFDFWALVLPLFSSFTIHTLMNSICFIFPLSSFLVSCAVHRGALRCAAARPVGRLSLSASIGAHCPQAQPAERSQSHRAHGRRGDNPSVLQLAGQ